MPAVTLVVPCYNEATRLPLEAFSQFDLPGHELRFLFVNDGSRDETSDVLNALCQRLGAGHRSLDLPDNVGKAEAVRAGIVAALAEAPDYVGYWDADLATSLDELPRFCNVLRDWPQVDLVFGARVKMLGRRIERRAHRHLYGRVFATVVSRLLSLAVYDTQCGAKLFRVTADTTTVFREPFRSRWIFDVELLARYLACWDAAEKDATECIHELPLQAWADVGGSKVKPIDGVIAASDLLRLFRRHRSEFKRRRQG